VATGAGKGRPVLVSSAAAIRVDPPPAAGSAEQQAESAELAALQARRTAQQTAAVRFWSENGAVLRWNEVARNLVAKHRTDHVRASRVYALLSVAQHDALLVARNNEELFRRPVPPAPAAPLIAPPKGWSYPSAEAAVASASANVLSYLYPSETERLSRMASEHESIWLWAGVRYRSDVVAGDVIGRKVAAVVVAHAKADRSDAIWRGTLPKGPGRWVSAPGDEPLAPSWGQTEPWLITSVADFRLDPPPAFRSPEFESALAEVKSFSDNRTPEQARVAALWADGLGSYSPPGRWNRIASDLILKHRWDDSRAARVLTLLNLAMMDAGIACWDNKYHYDLIRPSQADPSISTPVGLPNFPSYPSAHACFSGAAAEVLASFFPEERKTLQAKAEEAALSRVYGGIHYRFDGDAGLSLGRAVAHRAIERNRTEGWP
jgi:membrane-associated phospholipid phosphatase